MRLFRIFRGVFDHLSAWCGGNATKVGVLLFSLVIFVAGFGLRFLASAPAASVYFLDVGQGDSELVVFADGVKLLVDAGPPEGQAYRALGEALPVEDRYIDIVMMSHPQLDHYGGFADILRRYEVGVFVSNGEGSEAVAYAALAAELAARGIRSVVMRAGDIIRHGEDAFTVLSPVRTGSETPNDDALVGVLRIAGARVFFAADADEKVERDLLTRWSGPVDLLKVAHHGSKYGTSEVFLAATKPSVAVIEVGKNSYGHPAPETLARLDAAGARVFRTDRDHTVRVAFEAGKMRIFSMGRGFGE